MIVEPAVTIRAHHETNVKIEFLQLDEDDTILNGIICIRGRTYKLINTAPAYRMVPSGTLLVSKRPEEDLLQQLEDTPWGQVGTSMTMVNIVYFLIDMLIREQSIESSRSYLDWCIDILNNQNPVSRMPLSQVDTLNQRKAFSDAWYLVTAVNESE